MEGLWAKIKQQNRKIYLSLNVGLLFLAMFFVRHNTVLCNEISNLLNMLRIEHIEVFLSSAILPIKAIIFCLSQVVSVICVFEVVCAISFVVLIWVVYVFVREIAVVQKRENKDIVASDDVLSGRMTYQTIQRLLC